MNESYSLARKQQEAQRVEVSRREYHSRAYRTVQRAAVRKYAGPHEESLGNKGRRIGGFLDLSL